MAELDIIAHIVGEAVANRHSRPEVACAFARLARSLHSGDYLDPPKGPEFPDCVRALPTFDESIWGPPVDQRIIDRLDTYIEEVCARG